MNQTDEEADALFINKYNLLKLEGLKLWFSDGEVNEGEMGQRLAEIAFNHAGFMTRLYYSSPSVSKFD